MIRVGFRATWCIAAAALVITAACDQPVEVLLPARIEIAGVSPYLNVGDTIRLAAHVTDARSGELKARVSWSSSDVAIATIDSTGLVRGVARGVVILSANTDNGVSADTTLQIVLPGEMPTAAAGGLSFASVAVFGSSTCGITLAGELYCWGNNGQYQLGDGTITHRSVPTAIATERRFQSVSGDLEFVCAIDAGGKPYCWGSRFVSSVALVFATTPTAVPTLLEFTQVATGAAHACAIARDGSAHCWGENGLGQLGTGDYITAEFPREVVGGRRFIDLNAKGDFTCGVATTNEVLCWGGGDNTSLFGTAIPDACRIGSSFAARTIPCASSPLRIGPVTDAVEIGDQCYIDGSGNAYCWGLLGGAGPASCHAFSGEPFSCILDPVRVPSSQRVRSIQGRAVLDESGAMYFIVPFPTNEPNSAFWYIAAPGNLRFIAHSGKAVGYISGNLSPIDHACGITANNRAYCWGQNTYGQLGFEP